MSAAPPALALESLSVRYGAVDAVRGLSLEVNKGEIVGLIGPNGAGKSSTLHAIMGAAPVVGGDIRQDGASLVGRRSERVARGGIALVPEGRRIFGELTVEENLRLGLAARRTRASGPAFAYAFELFPILHEFRGRHAGALSGGQQQQLAIGRALAADPKLLILDEPTEGIQPSIIKDIERVIRMLAQSGDMAILLVEQYYDFGQALADHYMVMSRGKVVKQGLGADMERDNIREFVAL